MSVLKRSFLYNIRKTGKTATLFLLLLLITTLISVGSSMLHAVRKAAEKLRGTVGASFSIQGKPEEPDFNGGSFPANAAVTGRYLESILACGGIRTYNAQQSSFAGTDGFFTLSGRDFCPVSANTDTRWNQYFTLGTLRLTEGNHLSPERAEEALISKAFASENNLQAGGRFTLNSCEENRSDPQIQGSPISLTIAGIYESDPSMEFDEDTIFITHDAYWSLTGEAAGNYSGKVTFLVTDPSELDNILQEVEQEADIPWDQFILSKNSEKYDEVSYQLRTLERLTSILIITSVTISSALLLLILILRIRSRINEAGILLAVGIGKNRIILQYLAEAGMLLLPAYAASYLTGIFASGRINAWLRTLTGGVTACLSPENLLLQYLAEAAVAGTGVVAAALPVFRLNPNRILSKMS